jgi:Glycosyl transferase family 90
VTGFSRFFSFIRLASSKSEVNRTIVFADPPNSTNFVYASVPIASLNREMMDVAFVSSVDYDNYPGGLEQQVQDNRFDEAAALRDHWAHKYVLDLDGMGYSGRFLAFLGSDSAVIKSTVYQEFFSDWIQPWYASVLCTCFSDTNTLCSGFTTSHCRRHILKYTTFMPSSQVVHQMHSLL